jgi:hypothetical protein
MFLNYQEPFRFRLSAAVSLAFCPIYDSIHKLPHCHFYISSHHNPKFAMADVKKSVSFRTDAEIVDGTSEPLNGDEKSTAESHTADPAVDEVTVRCVNHSYMTALLIWLYRRCSKI